MVKILATVQPYRDQRGWEKASRHLVNGFLFEKYRHRVNIQPFSSNSTWTEHPPGWFQTTVILNARFISSLTQKSTVIKRWLFATCRQVKRRKLLQPGRTGFCCFFFFFQNNISIAALKGATIQGSKSQRIKVRLCNINVIIIAHKHGSLHSIIFFFCFFFVHTMCQQKRLLSSFLQPSSLSKCFIDID